ncbi:DUF397 domain-containing protein [Streptomyces poonensis]|uniref:DUF397 domain-containing protein n=1 Tax=Streptomyces poonensis TaxID=68255 RepID=A0A918UIV1_9ACTN|nr:DUF397 domain-containing protein [Streptomyces poonensis]GGZ13377.1 hypothetical protein GCM10010365_36520 [Streptomyces poonensis]GLJ91200.1 hypothetical protein GCM10017589_38060 [Streptomyces poonensis]
MTAVDIAWRKSSFSEDSDGNCIELAQHGEGVLMRESDAPGAVMAAHAHGLRMLIAAVKAGTADSTWAWHMPSKR